MESFGEEKCYINQLFLLAEHPQGRSRSESGEIGSIADGYKSPNERMSKEGNRASQDAIGGSGRKSQPMFDEYLARELKAVREELEEVKGHNLALQAKVEYLEDSVEQKQDKIAHLSSLLTSLATQLKDMVVQEVNQSKLTLNKEMKQKFDELERNIQRKLSQQNSPEFNGRNVLREFTLGHPHGSEGKDEKNSDSSLRDKQKGLEDMMSQLKETIALRVA
jgi:chromosome segregation ATPase